MRTLVLDPPPPGFAELLERRKMLGQDGYDEVWGGVYHMAPMARGKHGYLALQIAKYLAPFAASAGLIDTDAFNLGDGRDDFRVPDLGYHLAGFDPETVYYSTAAIVVEILSPGDETYEKLPFYAMHDVDEVLIADASAKRVQLLMLTDNRYHETDRSALLGVTVQQIEQAVNWP